MKIVKNSCKIALSAVLCAGMMLPTQASAETSEDDGNYYIDNNNIVSDALGYDDNINGNKVEVESVNAQQSIVLDAKSQPSDFNTQKQQDFSIDNVNFYINLRGNVLDTKLGSSHYLSDLFTSSVGYLEIGGDILQQKVKANKSYYMFIDNYYDSIVGANENDYVNIDNQIRSTISVPSDASVLANVKSQIENGTEVNDINGDKISSTLVSDKYFNVYWYILKEGNKYWHVDGILKKKEQPVVNTYTVNYIWTVPDGTPGLPDNITPPSTVTYAENDNVKIDKTFTPGRIVQVEGGQYEFIGWDKQDFAVTENTTVNGEWLWIPDEPVLNEYNVVTHFKYSANGEALADDVSETYIEGSLWEHADAPERIIMNDKIYLYDHTSGNEWAGTEIKDNQDVTHWYILEELPIENVHSLTQEYKISGTDTVIADSWTKELAELSAWEFIDAPKEIQYNGKTYELKEITGDSKIGDCILWDLSQTAWYVEKREQENPSVPPTPVTKYYSLTQEYRLYDKDVESIEDYIILAEPWTKKVAEHNGWEFIYPPTKIEKDGKVYLLKEITGDDRVGENLKSDLSQTAWYEINDIDPEPEPEPTPDEPRISDDPEEPVVEPDDTNDVVSDQKPTEEIQNDNTLAKTGDNTPLVAVLFVGLASIAAFVGRFSIKKNW